MATSQSEHNRCTSVEPRQRQQQHIGDVSLSTKLQGKGQVLSGNLGGKMGALTNGATILGLRRRNKHDKGQY